MQIQSSKMLSRSLDGRAVSWQFVISTNRAPQIHWSNFSWYVKSSWFSTPRSHWGFLLPYLIMIGVCVYGLWIGWPTVALLLLLLSCQCLCIFELNCQLFSLSDLFHLSVTRNVRNVRKSFQHGQQPFGKEKSILSQLNLAKLELEI